MTIQIDFPLTGYADLAVLRVRAGSVTGRRKYIEQLQQKLQQRSLTSICLEHKRSEQQRQNELLALIRRYDLVIIDAAIDIPELPPEVSGDDASPEDQALMAGKIHQRKAPSVEQIIRRMDAVVRRTPVWACILIGGKSSRMGHPKHLIEDSGKTTWLEREMKILAPLVDQVVVSGAGRLPDKLRDVTRLADIEGVAGPMTGIVAACRWQPMVSWLLVACDMPNLRNEAIQWLLDQRHAGCWGLVPKLVGRTRAEPLLAWYDYRAGHIFEEQLAGKNLRISDVAAHPKIESPVIPEHLRQSWQNINTPDQLSATFGHSQQNK